MPQSIAHRCQFADRAIELLRLARQQMSINLGVAVYSYHAGDLIQRKPRRSPKRNQRHSLQHIGAELAAQSLPANRINQPFFLIKAQR